MIGLTLCLVNAAFVFLHASKNVLLNEDWVHQQQQADPTKGKERILDILHQAGIYDLDQETLQKLPTWQQVVNMYGSHPRIYGLEDSCLHYKQLIKPHDAALAVAGAFNSGTNLLAELLIHNCHIQPRMDFYGNQNRGIRWQVNWGKHTPPELRESHSTYSDGKIPNEALFPAVTIRDPYVWMGSMCRHNYATQWFHDEQHCPNLIPNDVDRKAFLARDYPNDCEKEQHKTNFTLESKVVPVRVNYLAITKHHKSLAHMWNDWYRDYVDATFPRLVVRYEDLVFFAKEVTTQVCHCAGGSLNRGKFQFITDSAKKGTRQHGSEKTNFVDAIIRYGNVEERFKGMDAVDLEYAKKVLDPELMEFFGYMHHGETHNEKVDDVNTNNEQQQEEASVVKERYNNKDAVVMAGQHINNKKKKQQQRIRDDDAVLQHLRNGGVPDEVLNDESIRSELPTWSQITQQYGTAPVIAGLERCEEFQSNVPALDRHLGAAGMFNTGTNLITMLLKANCIIPERYEHYGPNATKEQYGMRWQVPWGKHTPARFRLEHHATKAAAIIKEHVLPIVLIRDPYDWMRSTCHHPYTARWPHNSDNCPHLVKTNGQYFPVSVKFAAERKTFHDSLAHLWNDWYREYYKEADYPRLLIRFEDVIFFQEQVTEQVCNCAGGIIRTDRPFHHLVNSAKDGPGHGRDRTGMVDAWIKYGKPKQARGGFNQADYEASQDALNKELMDAFGYHHPPPDE